MLKTSLSIDETLVASADSLVKACVAHERLLSAAVSVPGPSEDLVASASAVTVACLAHQHLVQLSKGAPVTPATPSIPRWKGLCQDSFPVERTDVYRIAVNVSGSRLAMLSYYNVEVYFLPSGAKAHAFDGTAQDKHPETGTTGRFGHLAGLCFAVNESETLLVLDSGQGWVQEVTVEGDHVRFIGKGSFGDHGTATAIACNATTIVVAKQCSIASPEALCVFDFGTGELLKTVGSYGFVSCLSFTSSGDLLVVDWCAGRSDVVRVFHFGSGKDFGLFGEVSEVSAARGPSVAILPDGRFAATGGGIQLHIFSAVPYQRRDPAVIIVNKTDGFERCNSSLCVEPVCVAVNSAILYVLCDDNRVRLFH